MVHFSEYKEAPLLFVAGKRHQKGALTFIVLQLRETRKKLLCGLACEVQKRKKEIKHVACTSAAVVAHAVLEMLVL